MLSTILMNTGTPNSTYAIKKTRLLDLKNGRRNIACIQVIIAL
jgi:hypothetical protein